MQDSKIETIMEEIAKARHHLDKEIELLKLACSGYVGNWVHDAANVTEIVYVYVTKVVVNDHANSIPEIYMNGTVVRGSNEGSAVNYVSIEKNGQYYVGHLEHLGKVEMSTVVEMIGHRHTGILDTLSSAVKADGR